MIDRRPNDLATQVRMHRSQYAGSFVLVEGKDDRLYCQQFLDLDLTKVIVAENKKNVCGTICLLEEDGFAGVLGLVDADFDHIEGAAARGPNVVVTELHDLESVLIQSEGLESLLAEYGNVQRLRGYRKDVRETLLAAARPVGCLRLYSARNGLDLRFAGMNYGKFVDRDDLSTDTAQLIGEVKRRSNRWDIADVSLADGIEEIERFGYDPWQLCNGDDLLGVLAIGLRRVFGNQNSTNVRRCRLRSALRLAYGPHIFDQSRIKKSLQDWERRNQGFKLL